MNELHLKCQCRTAEHFIEFSKFTDDDPEVEIVLMVTNYYSIWSRLRAALKFVFRRKGVVVGDISISQADALQLKRWLQQATKPVKKVPEQ